MSRNIDTTPIANASDFDFKGDRTRLYLFQFGAHGDTLVYAWGNDGLDDALEEAAGWLKEHAPGHFTEPDYADAAAEIGAPMFDWRKDEEWSAKVAERAETDLTYTESGYLASWEWHVNEATDPEEVAHIRWRSQEGADADEPDDTYAQPDHGEEDCASM